MQRFSFKSKTHRICSLALMTTIALIIFTVEAQIPVPVAIPGLKLGLSNVVTLFMLRRFQRKDAFIVLLCRILLGSMFAGQVMSLAYSLAGGLMAFAAMTVFLILSKGENAWFAGVVGAIFHNIGQIIVAIIAFDSKYVAYYFIVLFFCSVITGLFTGITAQLAVKYTPKLKYK